MSKSVQLESASRFFEDIIHKSNCRASAISEMQQNNGLIIALLR